MRILVKEWKLGRKLFHSIGINIAKSFVYFYIFFFILRAFSCAILCASNFFYKFTNSYSSEFNLKIIVLSIKYYTEYFICDFFLFILFLFIFFIISLYCIHSVCIFTHKCVKICGLLIIFSSVIEDNNQRWQWHERGDKK